LIGLVLRVELAVLDCGSKVRQDLDRFLPREIPLAETGPLRKVDPSDLAAVTRVVAEPREPRALAAVPQVRALFVEATFAALACWSHAAILLLCFGKVHRDHAAGFNGSRSRAAM
jgi:hypothetical protein